MSGISGKAEFEENEEATDAVVHESSRKALGDALGKERRDRVLSALYIVRQDAVSVVRQSAIHIWKALVHNTPRTGTPFVFLLDHLSFVCSARIIARTHQSDYSSTSGRNWGISRG